MSGSVYPRWEREDRVSRFFVRPSLPIYQIQEIPLIGESMFVAFASDKANLVGQFESEKNAKEACKRDFADKGKDLATETVRWGLKPGSEARIGACLLIRQPLLSGTRTRSTSGTRPANLFRFLSRRPRLQYLNQPTRLTCQRPEARNRRSVESDGLRIGLDFVGVRGECARLSPATGLFASEVCQGGIHPGEV
jgi:hypothetical protein